VHNLILNRQKYDFFWSFFQLSITTPQFYVFFSKFIAAASEVATAIKRKNRCKICGVFISIWAMLKKLFNIC
uniref:hypothetical protein n=1 Tax=Flavobacterium sp. TaxID=239 RepID=UPI004049D402